MNVPSTGELLASALEASRANPLTEEELAGLVSSKAANNFLLRLIGTLQDNNVAMASALGLQQQLLSEDGWRRAIQAQGSLIGRTQTVEGLIDLIIQGMRNVEDAKSA